MKNVWNRVFVVVALALTSPATLADVEIALAYPEGWTVVTSPPVHAASAERAAFVLYKYQDDPLDAYDRSLVIQANGDGSTSTTEFDGKVYGLIYSPSGNALLAYQVLGGGSSQRAIISNLLDGSGRVLWSRNHPSAGLHFSVTGEVLYAWFPGSFGSAGGSRIEFFDLAGNARGVIAITRSDVRGVIVPAREDRAIFVLTQSLVCMNRDLETVWQHDLPEAYANVTHVASLGESRFVMHLEDGMSVIVNLNGQVEYVYDPITLAVSDPGRTSLDLGRFRMSAGPSAGTVLLFDGTAAFVLDLASKTLSSKVLNVRGQETTNLDTSIMGQRLFVFSPTGVVIRRLN